MRLCLPEASPVFKAIEACSLKEAVDQFKKHHEKEIQKPPLDTPMRTRPMPKSQKARRSNISQVGQSPVDFERKQGQFEQVLAEVFV